MTTKVAKEKKPKSSKPSLAHPPYFQMIKEAILFLNEKTGSSSYAIAKYIEDKHKSVLPANFKKILAVQLKSCAAKGKLVKVKASFKLSSSGKKEEEKKTTVKKSVVDKPKRKATSKKPAMKKPGAVKPKQPKSIKSPLAKRAKKAASS